MKKTRFDYSSPKNEVIEIAYEGGILIGSDDPIGGGEDGEMEEGGEI